MYTVLRVKEDQNFCSSLVNVLIWRMYYLTGKFGNIVLTYIEKNHFRPYFWSAFWAICITLVFFSVPEALTSTLAEDEADGVIYPSNAYLKRQEEASRETRPADAHRLLYSPLGNTPVVDPMSTAYQQWLKEYRNENIPQEAIDEDYEQFVREVSPLLFSLGYKRLEPELKDLIESIPADSLESPERRFKPKGPIDISHGDDPTDPFANRQPEEEEILGQDISLGMEAKTSDTEVDEELNIAYEALQSGQLEVAIASYGSILKIDPENKQAMFGQASAYHRLGQYDEARETYLEILRKDPNHWPALNNLMVLAGEEAPQDALKELQELEVVNPEFSPIPAQIGLIYLRINELDNAVKYLTRAVVLAPENLAYRYNLAVVLDHGGYKRQAARLYKQILDAHDQGHALPENREKIYDRLAYLSSLPSAAIE